MTDKNHNLNCARAADIVSYLYDEIGAGEKAVFETHLAHCPTCSDELADFSLARFAVEDWRDAEFAHLKTPIIEIPFAENPSKETVSADSGSLLENLRRIFSPAPLWATSAAALAIFVGLVLTAANFFQPDLIAEKEIVNPGGSPVLSSVKNETQMRSAPSIEPKTADSAAKSSASPNENEASEKRKTVRRNQAPENRKTFAVEVSANSPKIKNARESGENIAASDSKNSNNSARKTSARANRPAPTLNSFDEEEDNTLRLVELFEEIDAGE